MDAERAELERRYIASGAVEDEAALLGRDLRAGELEPERLAFAAWPRYPAAVAVLGSTDGPPAHLREAWVRFGLHVAEAALDRVLPSMPTKSRYTSPPTHALEAVRAGLREWPPARTRDPERVSSDFWSDPKSFGHGNEPPFYAVLHACCYAQMALHAPLEPDPEREAARRAEHEQIAAFFRARGRPAPELGPEHATRALALAASAAAYEGLQRAGRLSASEARLLIARYAYERLVPWLLGRRDPVRDLVALARPALGQELEAAEAALAADPGDPALLQAVAERSAAAGWSYEGRSLREWGEELAQGWNRSEEALRRLKRFGPKATLAALRAFEQPGVSPEQQALELVEELGRGALAAEGAVLERLRRFEAGQHVGQPGQGSWTLIRALGALGTPSALAGLGRLLSDEGRDDHAFVEAAARALARAGAGAVPVLEARLGAPDPIAAAWAAVALAQLGGHPSLLPALRAALGITGWHYLRERVVRALVFRGLQREARAELVGALEPGADHYLLELLCSLVVREGWHADPAVRARLGALLAHEDERAQAAARAALAGRDPCDDGRWRPPLYG
ncbi:MAG: hypothetical protein AB7N76_14610 [Planctomycetota bacterium]